MCSYGHVSVRCEMYVDLCGISLCFNSWFWLLSGSFQETGTFWGMFDLSLSNLLVGGIIDSMDLVDRFMDRRGPEVLYILHLNLFVSLLLLRHVFVPSLTTSCECIISSMLWGISYNLVHTSNWIYRLTDCIFRSQRSWWPHMKTGTHNHSAVYLFFLLCMFAVVLCCCSVFGCVIVFWGLYIRGLTVESQS